MPRAPARPKKETWLDLMPDGTPEPTLITRDELLGLLRDRGVDVDEVALVYWEKAGVLPRAVRRWRDGAPRALYPIFAVYPIAELRDLQAKGLSLHDLRPRLMASAGSAARAWARNDAVWRGRLQGPVERAWGALEDLAWAWQRAGHAQGIAGVRVQFVGADGEPVPDAELALPIRPE